MSEDEAADDADWFEEALGESADDSAADGDESAPGPDETGGGPDTDADTDASEGGADADTDAGEVAADADADEPDADAPDAAVGEGASGDLGNPFAEDAGSDDASTGEGSSPFAEDTDNAFGGASDDAGGADWAGGRGDAAPESSFGGDTGDAGDAGGGMFDDDFASAFQGGGGGDEDFEEDYVSDIPRIDLGVTGLDDMIQGGIPARHLLTCIGGPGTGKTTFGLQFLDHGIRNDQDGVFITLEQSHEAILDTAEEHGWRFEEYEAEGSLAIVDLDPVEMANSLDNIRGELPDLIEQFGADRLVMDSVSLLEMMYDDQARRRTEVFDFTRSLKKAGVTTFLTSEASETNPYVSRHGIIEYLTDAVFILQYIRGETQETRLAVEIQKIRNANHSREKKPYELTSEGISVYQQANIF